MKNIKYSLRKYPSRPKEIFKPKMCLCGHKWVNHIGTGFLLCVLSAFSTWFEHCEICMCPHYKEVDYEP